MTYVKRELGVVGSRIHKKLVKTSDGEYIGLLYSVSRDKKLVLVYEGLDVNPFILSTKKVKLKPTYSVSDITHLDFIILKADLHNTRNLACTE